MVLANLQLPVAIAEVETVALAIAPHLATGALVGLHPFTVAVDLELVLPNVPEAVLINVALMIVAADAETARDGAVGKHRGDVDACAARIIMIAHLAFIFSKESVASIVGTNLALQAGLLDELHHLHKLLFAELEHRFVGGTAERKHSKQAPAADA